jgi:carboxyl-terminal processing protease
LGNQRVQSDTTFTKIKEFAEWLSKQNETPRSLKLEKYKEQQKAFTATAKQLESLLKLKGQMDVTALPGEENRWENDKAKQERFNNWIKDRQKDIYLDQAVKVVNDMIGQQNLANGKKTEEPAKKGF